MKTPPEISSGGVLRLVPIREKHMEIVEVEIRRTINTSRYGVLTTGDLLRTSPGYAKHLVDEVGAATYRQKTPKTTVKKRSGNRKKVR